MKLNEEQEKMMLGIYKTYENYFRSLRQPILDAFDIYKNNIFYGIETETDEEKLINLMWYQDLLDLKESALENVPDKIKRYVI